MEYHIDNRYTYADEWDVSYFNRGPGAAMNKLWIILAVFVILMFTAAPWVFIFLLNALGE